MQRFVQIDALRGLFLVLILINHLHSFISDYTYEPFGFVSAAAGFVYLSGLVAGLVYTRKLIRDGRDEMLRSVWKRATKIYQYHIALYILLFLLMVLIQPISDYWVNFWGEHMGFPETNRHQAFLLGFFLLFLPDGMDILPMYFVFLLLLPLAIRQFRRDKPGSVFLVSFVVWAASQLGIKNILARFFLDGLPVYLGYFDVFGYQLIFIGGAYIGYCLCTGGLRKDLYEPKFLLPALCVAAFFFALRHDFIELQIPEWQRLITKAKVGPLRLLNFCAQVYLIAYVLHRFPTWMRWSPLVFLGRHSLQVFAYHLLLILLIQPFAKEEYLGRAGVLLVVVVSVASLYLPAYLHQLYQDRKRVPMLQKAVK